MIQAQAKAPVPIAIPAACHNVIPPRRRRFLSLSLKNYSIVDGPRTANGVVPAAKRLSASASAKDGAAARQGAAAAIKTPLNGVVAAVSNATAVTGEAFASSSSSSPLSRKSPRLHASKTKSGALVSTPSHVHVPSHKKRSSISLSSNNGQIETADIISSSSSSSAAASASSPPASSSSSASSSSLSSSSESSSSSSFMASTHRPAASSSAPRRRPPAPARPHPQRPRPSPHTPLAQTLSASASPVTSRSSSPFNGGGGSNGPLSSPSDSSSPSSSLLRRYSHHDVSALRAESRSVRRNSFDYMTDLPRGRVKTLRESGTWARVAVDPDDNLYLLGRQGKTLEIIYAHSHTCMATSRPCPVRYPSCTSVLNSSRAMDHPPSTHQSSSLSSLGSPFFRSPRASHASPRSSVNIATSILSSPLASSGSSSLFGPAGSPNTPPAPTPSLLSRSSIARRTSLPLGSPNVDAQNPISNNGAGDDATHVSVTPSSPSLHSTPRRSLNLHSRSIVLTHPSAAVSPVHGQMLDPMSGGASLATPQHSTRSRRGSSASTDHRRSSTASTLVEAAAAVANGDDSHPLPPPFPLHHNHPSHTHAQTVHARHRGSLSASEPPTRSASPSFSAMSLSELEASPALSSLSVSATPATAALSLREPPSTFSLASPSGTSDKKRSRSPSRHQQGLAATPSSGTHTQHMGATRRRVSLSRNSQENIAMTIESASRRSSLSRSSMASLSQTLEKDNLAVSTASQLLALSHNVGVHERKASCEPTVDVCDSAASSKSNSKTPSSSSSSNGSSSGPSKPKRRSVSAEQPLTLTRANPAARNVTSDPTDSPVLSAVLSPARLPPRPPLPSAKPPSPAAPTPKRHSHGGCGAVTSTSPSELNGVVPVTPTSMSAPPSTRAKREKSLKEQQQQRQQQQPQQHRCPGCDPSLANEDSCRPRSRTQQIYGPDIYWLLGLCYLEGYLYLCDSTRHCIFRLDPHTGFMAVWAGAVDKPGYQDSRSHHALFHEPVGMCVGHDGRLYVSDHGNNVIRWICTADGRVGTLLHLNKPWRIFRGEPGFIYHCDFFGHRVDRINTDTGVVTVLIGQDALAAQALSNRFSAAAASVSGAAMASSTSSSTSTSNPRLRTAGGNSPLGSASASFTSHRHSPRTPKLSRLALSERKLLDNNSLSNLSANSAHTSSTDDEKTPSSEEKSAFSPRSGITAASAPVSRRTSQLRGSGAPHNSSSPFSALSAVSPHSNGVGLLPSQRKAPPPPHSTNGNLQIKRTPTLRLPAPIAQKAKPRAATSSPRRSLTASALVRPTPLSPYTSGSEAAAAASSAASLSKRVSASRAPPSSSSSKRAAAAAAWASASTSTPPSGPTTPSASRRQSVSRSISNGLASSRPHSSSAESRRSSMSESKSASRTASKSHGARLISSTSRLHRHTRALSTGANGEQAERKSVSTPRKSSMSKPSRAQEQTEHKVGNGSEDASTCPPSPLRSQSSIITAHPSSLRSPALTPRSLPAIRNSLRTPDPDIDLDAIAMTLHPMMTRRGHTLLGGGGGGESGGGGGSAPVSPYFTSSPPSDMLGRNLLLNSHHAPQTSPRQSITPNSPLLRHFYGAGGSEGSVNPVGGGDPVMRNIVTALRHQRRHHSSRAASPSPGNSIFASGEDSTVVAGVLPPSRPSGTSGKTASPRGSAGALGIQALPPGAGLGGPGMSPGRSMMSHLSPPHHIGDFLPDGVRLLSSADVHAFYVARDMHGALYTFEGTHIRCVAPDLKLVSAFAGWPGSVGTVDGVGPQARFSVIRSIAFNPWSDTIFVLDGSSKRHIRKILLPTHKHLERVRAAVSASQLGSVVGHDICHLLASFCYRADCLCDTQDRCVTCAQADFSQRHTATTSATNTRLSSALRRTPRLSSLSPAVGARSSAAGAAVNGTHSTRRPLSDSGNSRNASTPTAAVNATSNASNAPLSAALVLKKPNPVKPKRRSSGACGSSSQKAKGSNQKANGNNQKANGSSEKANGAAAVRNGHVRSPSKPPRPPA